MNKFTRFLYALIMIVVFFIGTAFGQCPNGTYLDIIINPDQYPEETSWAVLNDNLDTIVAGGPYDNIVDYSPQVTQLCVPNGDYEFVVSDGYGDGLQGSLWGGQDGSYYLVRCNDTLVEMDSANFGFVSYHGFTVEDCAPPPPIYGCMDDSFLEFLPIATLDTGMCYTPKVYGCTDSIAFNYEDLANTDILIDSCTHTLELTDLAGNGWAGAYLQVFQGNNFLGIFTLDDGFDTTFTFELSISEPISVKFNITQQSQFTSVQCGYSVYSEEHVAIDAPGGFASPLVPFVIVNGMPYCGDECIERTYGCIDSLAVNYNDTVNTDDGSCYYNPGCTNPIYLEYDASYDYDNGSCATLVVLGCMDSTAYNYDPLANVELSGSCIPYVYGCMDPIMFNYDPLATASDTCIPYIYGCTDASMFNYNINANTDNGSCIPFVYGCTDDTMFNYNPLANTDNGSCTPFVYGCTDQDAINYSQLANADDGSCIDVVLGCTDSTAFNYSILANTDDGSCIPVVWGCTDGAAFNFNVLANTDDGSCIPVIFGCIDPTMWNYCDTCNTDNGNCIPYYYGCTDSTAINYDDNANTNNGSCIYPLLGCTDPSAVNYNSSANVEDSTCYFSAGCNVGDIYYIPNECFEWVIDIDQYCCDNTWDATCDNLYQYCLDGWSGPTDVQNIRSSVLSAYPNPTKGNIYFTKSVDVTFYNMLGKKISEHKSVNFVSLQIGPGIYNAIVKHDQLYISIKVIVND